jgi:RHS repeat-associated protein
MTTTPQPFNLSTGFTLNYDAWNRLVAVNTGSVAAYAYDGANRRIAKTAGGVTRDYYYSDQWQVLEERLSTDPTAADRRFVWGMRGVDDLVRRDREVWVWVPAPPRPPHWHPGHGGPHGSSAAGSSSGSGWWSSSSGSSGGPVEVTERLYALDDPLNITAIIDGSTGAVLERYGFSGFGVPNYMNASFGSISGSAYDWETLFASYRYDTDTGLYQVRNRFYHPNLGRWPTRDPIGESGAA